ncbi:hypothetical protein DHW03_00425 [Pedobacter yonginense]|uniref:DUF4397 domain-containing protein n=1 Tax=Pedobacter yonginense TaxID=651869 RepID=A0A317ET80_9SPHI|nr:DUF4397 domain-containing protein [Pedobacter yonginense]PWS28358.1 hypothetical protein DHW03_00425 [Pedobacter yonginense]
MKIFTNLSIAFNTLFLLIICSFTLVSCKKHDPDVVVNGASKVKMINAVQTEFNQEVYFDGVKVTAAALSFGESSDYLKVSSGSRNVSFKGTNNVSTQALINFTPSITYTTFLVSDRNGNREVVSYEDNLSNTETGKAKIKLINLTPNFATGINVTVQGGTQFVNGLQYKEASNYFNVDAGMNLRFNVVGSGSIKTIDGTLLEAGKIYTIWFSGVTAATLENHIVVDN